MSVDLWVYRVDCGIDPTEGTDIGGFSVEALDGAIGKIDAAYYEPGTSYIVVDTGPWILGKKVALPAGVIDRVDFDEEKVYVDRTKEQIKAAPVYGPTFSKGNQEELGTYYGAGGPGFR